jgi:hypothetical protein
MQHHIVGPMDRGEDFVELAERITLRRQEVLRSLEFA